MIPKDPLLTYKGESLVALLRDDFMQFAITGIMAAGKSNDPAQAIDTILTELFDAYLEKFGRNLGATKFICGDKLTIFDFTIGGFFCNVVLNLKGHHNQVWKKHLDEKAPDNVKAYLSNYQEAMKEYLEKRPEAAM